MMENIKGQIEKELTWKFWLIFSATILLYIIALAVIYWHSGYCLGFENIDLSATNNYFLALTAGLTPIITMASIWIFYRTLKTQQTEIQQSQLRFEIQQFESSFFKMLEKLQRIRDEIEIEDEFYPYGLKKYKGILFFEYNMFVLRYLRLALINKRAVAHEDWVSYLQIKDFSTNEVESDEMKYLFEKDHNKYEKIINSEIESERIDYASFKFKINSENLEMADSFSEKKETWLCKYSFNRVYYKCHNTSDLYFNHLINTLRFLDNNSELFDKLDDIKIKNRVQLYSSMISSDMYQIELAFLFYYAYLFDDVDNLCSKYNLFKKLDKSYLLDINHSELIKGVKIKDMQEHYYSRNKTV